MGTRQLATDPRVCELTSSWGVRAKLDLKQLVSFVSNEGLLGMSHCAELSQSSSCCSLRNSGAHPLRNQSEKTTRDLPSEKNNLLLFGLNFALIG